MKDNYDKSIQLRCIVCGDDSSFESNDDKSYIKCVRCGREYHGGYDEIVELNQDLIDEEVDKIGEEIKKDIEDQIGKMFK